MTDATTNKPIILVVDDSRLMRVAARKILKSDFEVLEAEDGEVAWEVLQSNANIDLVMSDLSMPNLDGLGLVKKIRAAAEPHLRDIPVIIVTGAEDDDGSKESALSTGASDFITKPFDSVQLLARAQAQARQQRTQQALEHSEVRKQQLEERDSLDELTGLANKRAFLEHLEEGLSYAIRHRTELAVLLIQVDRYKVLFLRRGKESAEGAGAPFSSHRWLISATVVRSVYFQSSWRVVGKPRSRKRASAALRLAASELSGNSCTAATSSLSGRARALMRLRPP